MIQKQKRPFVPPVILQEVQLDIDSPILEGSVVTKKTVIETAGQQVETRNFDTSGFNSTWE